MTTKVFVICGHGAGDPGACAGGRTEADLVRRLAGRMRALGGSAVEVGDTSVNWYDSNYISKGRCPKGVPAVELHMDSAAASAKGGHVEIKKGFEPDAIDEALGEFITGMFPGRADAGGIRRRSDLANLNRAASAGVNYRLLECCFISNQSDRERFIDQMDDLARGILGAFGVEAGGSAGTAAGDPSQGATEPQEGYLVKVTDPELNIREGPGTDRAVVGVIRDLGTYTIVGEADGPGASRWGRLKSGAGWISLDRCERAGSSKTYTVVAGDTLIGIGERLGVDWHELAERNGVEKPYTIFPGQQLRV